jgi:hypothetical protein
VSLCVGFGEKFKKTEKADKRELSKLSLSLCFKIHQQHHHLQIIIITTERSYNTEKERE